MISFYLCLTPYLEENKDVENADIKNTFVIIYRNC